MSVRCLQVAQETGWEVCFIEARISASAGQSFQAGAMGFCVGTIGSVI